MLGEYIVLAMFLIHLYDIWRIEEYDDANFLEH
jgi:hypothetical protein